MTTRIAVTETKNAYSAMPKAVADLPSLAGVLDAVRDANLDHHCALIEAAAERGVQAIGLGELFAAPYFALTEPDEMWIDLAESAEDGPTVTRMRALASKCRMVIVAPIYEQHPSGRRYNTAVVIDADGSVLGHYRKTHIPCGTNEQGTFVETAYYGRGDIAPHFPVFETRAGRVGVAICYDRHFEGVMRSLARNGAQLVFSPAVTFGAKSERMWGIEFEVDASRHNLFIAGSNRRGVEPPWDVEYFGQSHVVGPNGKLDCQSDHEHLIIADVDLASLASADGSGWDLPRDARPEIYR